MRPEFTLFRRLTAGLAACILAGVLTPAALAGFREERTIRAGELLVKNLIGRVDVRSHDGPDFEVDVRVEGSDATPERVTIDFVEGDRAELVVGFPVGESRKYVYPGIGRGKTSFDPSDGGGSAIGRMLGLNRQIEVTADGPGLEIWVDVTVSVPRGKSLEVRHGAGGIHAESVDASLDLACRACPIEVAGVRGRVVADTGSGSISARDVEGDLSADTGSGGVRLTDCRGGRISVDTGSGNVELENVDAGELLVDTGSGRVDAREVGADEMKIDTGSGGVEMEMARMGGGSFAIDTGAGAVSLRLPAAASAEIVADTGGGGIRFEPGDRFEVVERDDDSVVLRVGGGDARVRLDTGSGGIRISI